MGLHASELTVQAAQGAYELLFICRLAPVELEQPLLHDEHHCLQVSVVGLLLVPGCEPRVYRHRPQQFNIIISPADDN